MGKMKIIVSYKHFTHIPLFSIDWFTFVVTSANFIFSLKMAAFRISESRRTAENMIKKLWKTCLGKKHLYRQGMRAG